MARLVQKRLQIRGPVAGIPPPAPQGPNANTPPEVNGATPPPTTQGSQGAPVDPPWLKVQQEPVDGYYYYGRCGTDGQCRYLAVHQSLITNAEHPNPPGALPPAAVADVRRRATAGGQVSEELQHLPGAMSATETAFPAAYQARMAAATGGRPGAGGHGFVGGGGGPAAQGTTYTPLEAELMSRLGDLSDEEKRLFLQERFPMPSLGRDGRPLRGHALERAQSARNREIDNYLHNTSTDRQVPPVSDSAAVRRWLGDRVALDEIVSLRRENPQLTPAQAYERLRQHHLISENSPAPNSTTWPQGFDPSSRSATLPFGWHGAEMNRERAARLAPPPPPDPQRQQSEGYVRAQEIAAEVQREQMKQQAILEIAKMMLDLFKTLVDMGQKYQQGMLQVGTSVSQQMSRQR